MEEMTGPHGRPAVKNPAKFLQMFVPYLDVQE